jgi:hypothetical protein
MEYTGLSSGFKQDIVKAEQAEEEIFNSLCRHYPDTFGSYVEKFHSDSSNKTERKEYDIGIITKAGNRVLFEIKDDARSQKTCKAFVETCSFGCDSGLTTTKADIWLQRIWCFNKQIICFYKTEYLKAYIQRHEKCLTKLPDTYRDGNRTAASGYLIPVLDFKINSMVVGRTTFREYMSRYK